MKQHVGFAVRVAAFAVVLVLATFVHVGMYGVVASSDTALELVAQIQGQAGERIRWIEALEGLDQHPGEIVLAVMNTASPETIWKAVLDPVTGEAVSVTQKQTLHQLELVRYRLFESSDGTLFTASGISGYRPAYFSTDAGESWRTADVGTVYPPNTTFSYAEFRGSVYVGTGYEPYPGEIYRWLGEGRWERIWQSPWPTRNMVNAMTVFHDRLFISTPHYAAGSPVPGTPSALVSDDGIHFVPTPGLPADLKQLLRFFVVGDQLLAAGSMEMPGQDRMFRWIAAEGRWEQIADYAGRWTWRPHIAALAQGDSLYAYGQVTGDEAGGLYRSRDFGVTWVQIAPMPGRTAMSLTAYLGDLYLGTDADSAGVAYLYRYRLSNNQPPGAILARVYLDRNLDGALSAREIGLPGWRVTLYDNNGGKVGEKTTNNNGKANFWDLAPGLYKICSANNGNLYNAQPGVPDPALGNQACYSVNVAPGAAWEVFFGFGPKPPPFVRRAAVEDGLREINNPTIEQGQYGSQPFVDLDADLPLAAPGLYLPLIKR